MTGRSFRLDSIPRVAAAPSASADMQTLIIAVAALKDAVETLARQSPDNVNSALRVSELEKLGLAKTYPDGTVYSDISTRFVTKEFAADAFVFAGYGGMNRQTPGATPILDATWRTLEFDTSVPAAKNISTDPATNTLQFLQDGVWAASLTFSLDHNELNAGRTIQVRLFDETDAAQLGQIVNVGVGRNVEVTTFANINLIALTDAQEGHPIRVEVRTDDVFSAVNWTLSNFVVWAVGEYPDPLP